MYWALIKNGIVINTIVADAKFIDLIKDQYDFCLELEHQPGGPGIGWNYDGQNFTPPADQG